MNDIQIKMIARMNVHEQRINEIDREIRNLEGDKELIKFSKLSTVEKVCRKKDIEAEIRQLEYERENASIIIESSVEEYMESDPFWRYM